MTLERVENPDKVEVIRADRRKLPCGKYKAAGYEARQAFDIKISRVVTEYRAEIVEEAEGKRFVASFPEGITKAAQYGADLKGHCSIYVTVQLTPCKRILEYFEEQMGIAVSKGFLYNFNQEAYEYLETFEGKSKAELAKSEALHVDETSINNNGDRYWLHSASNRRWTYFYPHERRGTEAMDSIGILPQFRGILCRDHLKGVLRLSLYARAL